MFILYSKAASLEDHVFLRAGPHPGPYSCSGSCTFISKGYDEMTIHHFLLLPKIETISVSTRAPIRYFKRPSSATI